MPGKRGAPADGGKSARRAAPVAGWPFVAGWSAGPGGAVAARRAGEVAILAFSGRPVLRHAARPGGAASGRRVLFLTLVAGVASFRPWDGRLRPVGVGEVLVLDSEATLDVRGEAGAVLAGVTVPLHLISPRFVAPERLRGGALRAHGGALAQLLHQLLAGLMTPGRATPGAGALVDAVGGLASAVLEDCWAQEVNPGQARRGVRLDQIGQHIRRHFADPKLTPGAAAEALGLSRRYVHKLYAQEGRSFRQELVALRIESCLRALADEKQAAKTIADIALAAGYTDISQFNRHFRRLKGETPTAVRRRFASAGRPRKPARRKPRVPAAPPRSTPAVRPPAVG